MFSNEHRYVCRLQIRFLSPSHCAHAGKAQHPGVHWDHMRNFTQALLTVAFIGYLKNVAPAVTLNENAVCELIMIHRHIHYIHTVKNLKMRGLFYVRPQLYIVCQIFSEFVSQKDKWFVITCDFITEAGTVITSVQLVRLVFYFLYKLINNTFPAICHRRYEMLERCWVSGEADK